MGTGSAAPLGANDALRRALAGQYRAGLAMLDEAVRRCPDELWTRGAPDAAFGEVAYHALFYTHLYLGRDEASFRPWPGHRDDVQEADATAGRSRPDEDRSRMPETCGQDEVLAYAAYLDERIDALLAAIDLGAEQSGFSWYPIPKLDHQLVNLRHLQHHVGQLADRLRAELGPGATWIARRESDD